jgi:ferritin-like metal-binding protein YciE
MDTQPDVLAETVRAKRVAIDNDLELLRVKLQKADPRRLDVARVTRTAGPVAAGLAAAWWWARHRRPVNSLQQLLIRELSDLYASERLQAKGLQGLFAKAGNPELKQALERHYAETLQHAERLERVFRVIGVRPRRGAEAGVTAMLDESKRLLRQTRDAGVRDAWLIAMAQRLEHMEIASYGTARTFAATLGYVPAAQLLQQTLEEERNADETLTRLAERFVNPQLIR